MIPPSYYDVWVEWLGDVGRGVGNPQRDYIADPQAFIDWIRRNEAARRPSYASVQPFSGYENPQCIDRLFYDFDCKESPEKAAEEALDFSKRLKEFYDIEALVTLSGNKGSHVHPFLEAPFGIGIAKEKLKKIYATFQRMILGKHIYHTLDSSVIGDISQLARIPLTHHQKTGKLCQPLNLDGKPIELEPSYVKYYRAHGLSFELCKKALYHTAKEIEKIKKARERGSKQPRKKHHGSSIRPCIKAVLESGNIHTPEHKMKLAAVAELSARGWGANRIINSFSEMAGFDRQKTENIVKHALKVGYRPFKCSTIDGLGGCLHSECPIYRRRRRK